MMHFLLLLLFNSNMLVLEVDQRSTIKVSTIFSKQVKITWSKIMVST